MQHVSSRDSCVYGKCGIVFVCTLPKVGWDLVESGIPSPCSIPQVEGGKTEKKSSNEQVSLALSCETLWLERASKHLNLVNFQQVELLAEERGPSAISYI